jgi:hypothetical protein
MGTGLMATAPVLHRRIDPRCPMRGKHQPVFTFHPRILSQHPVALRLREAWISLEQERVGLLARLFQTRVPGPRTQSNKLTVA